jgi:hypothetical protein
MYTATKRQLAQTVQEYLANWDISNEQAVDIRDVYVVLDRVTNKYAKLGLLENMSYGDRNTPDSYLTTFKNVPFGLDTNQDICYSILPARYINLPNGRGIDAIFPTGSRGDSLYPLPRHFLGAFKYSNGKKLSGNDGYWVEGQTVYYTKKYDVSGVVKMVMRLVIADSSSIDEDATYPIDAGMEKTILDEVIAFFMPNQIRAQDKVSDNRQS